MSPAQWWAEVVDSLLVVSQEGYRSRIGECRGLLHFPQQSLGGLKIAPG